MLPVTQTYLLLLLCSFAVSVMGQSKVETSEDGSSGTITFSTPDLNDDEAHSPWVPNHLKCDACRVVAYQFWAKFQDFNYKRKSLKYIVPEYELTDLVDKICADQETWEGYGIKEIKKVKRLSGPGLETSDTPGVTAGGGKWPLRLRDMCEQFIGLIGEVPIYNIYKKNPKSKRKLEDYLCRGKGIRGECTKIVKDEL